MPSQRTEALRLIVRSGEPQDGFLVRLKKPYGKPWRLEPLDPADLTVPGTPGEPGEDGEDGREIELGTNATHIRWRYASESAWSNLVALSLLTGAQGSQGLQGIQGIQGVKGDTGDQGDTGPQGDTGGTGPVGASVELQNNGTHIQWRQVGAGSWTSIVALAAITGPQGEQGTQGIQGIQGNQGNTGNTGAAGATILSGSGAPSGGSNGDYYFRTTTGELFGPKAAGSWPGSGTSLVGPQGTQGIQGIQGIQGTTGSAGSNGSNGAAGATILSGSGAPGGGVGANGDYYFRTDTGALYGPKAAGAWPGAGTSLVGPQGIQGIQGNTGNTGNTGSAGTNGLGWSARALKTSDQTAIGTAFATITGLDLAVAASTAYYFEFHILADADATTTGIDVSVTGPASPTQIEYECEVYSSATAKAFSSATAYDANPANANSAGTARRWYRIRGVLRNGSNAGNLSARIKRENVGSGPNVRAGSFGLLTLLS